VSHNFLTEIERAHSPFTITLIRLLQQPQQLSVQVRMKLPLHKVAQVAVALVASVTVAQLPSTHAYTFGHIPEVKSFRSIISSRSLYLNNRDSNDDARRKLDPRRQDWEDRSLKYYRTVRRMDPPPATAVVIGQETLAQQRHSAAAKKLENEYRKEFVSLAMEHYFALKKIKSGQLEHAEMICKL
jgi:hypothetical protein